MFSRVLSLRNYNRVSQVRQLASDKVTYYGKGLPCLGIRRETINAWERRAPLAPNHVKRLTKAGVKVLIQPSNRRAFPIQDYKSAGAIVKEDLSEASLIVSVKQVPIDQLIPNKTYAFFSHTIKAQDDNMQMLDTILQRKIRLIDYEKIVDSTGKRVVMFGKWAGYAGFIDILHGLGLRLLALGHHTPFLHIGLAHNYNNSHMAINAVRDCGYEIALNRLPNSLGPLTFVFTGSGNVSKGAQELFKHLPHEFVDVSTLQEVAKKGQRNKVYGCVVGRAEHMMRKDGKPFDEADYVKNPKQYISKFATEIAPFANVIINGVYWDADTPRLITIPDAKNLLSPKRTNIDVPGCPSLPHKLTAICDISADPGGSIEFMQECTTIDKPFVMYDADFNKTANTFDSPSGCLVCSIDNMPAQMPTEATEMFGNLLTPHIMDMINCTTDIPYDQLNVSPTIRNAIITDNGDYTPDYEYIKYLRGEKMRLARKRPITAKNEKKILLLGAGMVSDPFAAYFAKQDDINVTVGTQAQSDGDRLSNYGHNIDFIAVDAIKETDTLNKLIGEHDLVVSLLPYIYHTHVAKLCIQNKTNLVTSSYISPEMQALENEAISAGITIMMESGLDPGIDHMLAMECIDQVHEHGGKIKSFVSFCGGLPAPQFSDNALRYKFSWSPKGVLMALMNPARYLYNGEIVDLDADGGVLNQLYPIDFMPGFNLIGYANRDSTKYNSIYGIQNECNTMLRGTLRYKGFENTIKALKTLGLLDTTNKDFLDPTNGPDLTWKQVMAILLNQQPDIFPDSVKNIAKDMLRSDNYDISVLEQLGLFSDNIIADKMGNPLDTLVGHLSKVLSFKKNEQDLVILNHDISAEMPNGEYAKHRISLTTYGEPNGHSAMAKTVGYTTAIVSHMVVSGEIQRKGLVRPVTKEIYRPALKRLEDFNIKATSQIIEQRRF
uniref:Saccharopine dehydrogenase n=1 Tax=Parastrongyloides trichosuri TaxID=131310 RepID=A0A0N5A3W0_PARTI